MKRTLPLLLLVPALGCQGGDSATRKDLEASQAPVEISLAEAGLSAEALDPSADPCTDFYRYACGGWLDATEIPADKPVWNRSFNVMHEENLHTLRTLLEEAAQAPADDEVHQKIGAFYAACMDEEAIAERGLGAASELLDPIATLTDAKQVPALLTALHTHRIWAGFDLAPDQSQEDATQMMAFIDQNGLGLPSREQYLADDDDAKALREAYRGHVARMLVLSGWPEADAKTGADAVLALETKLAEVSQTPVARRSPENLWHPMALEGLEQVAPHFPWKTYLAAQDLDPTATVNVMNPEFLARLDGLLTEAPVDTWKAYLTFHVLADLASEDALPEPFVAERFKLVQKLYGIPAQPARWKRCVNHTDDALGELVGQAYVERAFAGGSKAEANRMVQAILAAFETKLDQLDWMDAETRALAKEKLASLKAKIGYPDVWRTYPFAVQADRHAENVLAARAAENQRLLAQVGAPLDPHEWHMSPATVNAYYSPSRGDIVFPAAILQPPMFSVDRPMAVNLGGIGMVIGHEITHGFDDEGSQYDAQGNVKNWWTEASAKAFEAQGQCVADAYGRYEALPGLPLDGKLTLGENIADIGGVKIALDALERLREDRPPLTAGGYAEDQLFFLGFAQAWCAEYRPEILKLLVQTDPHSPAMYRVNGSLPHVPAFAEAFQCEAGATMAPKDRCEVW